MGINYRFNEWRESGEKAEEWSPMATSLISKNVASEHVNGFRVDHIMYLHHIEGFTVQETSFKEKLKSKWSRLEAIAGAELRVQKMEKDIVHHYEEREKAMFGKSMVVVMSRRVTIDLYKEIVKLRPEWHSDDDKGAIKLVMIGSSSDHVEWQPFIGNKKRREFLARRMKDNDVPLKVVIVRDMWLTGFDGPSMNTMYIDKPMKSHNLMQAIARVN